LAFPSTILFASLCADLCADLQAHLFGLTTRSTNFHLRKKCFKRFLMLLNFDPASCSSVSMVLSASLFCLRMVRSKEAINHEACLEMQIIFVKVDRAVAFFSP
jgi:hypothetical protein